MIRFGVAAAAASLMFGQPAIAACQLGAVAVLPMEKVGDHFMFPATVNGHETKFVLDTGAFATMLDSKAAAQLGVRLNVTAADAYGIGGTRTIYRGKAAKFQIGNMNADGMTVGGQELWGGNGPYAAAAGLFGMNMMAAYDIDIDTQGHRLAIYHADGDCTKPTVTLAAPLYVTKLLPVNYDRQADVEITLDGHRMRANIDSGAAHTAIYRNAASRMGIDLSGLASPGPDSATGIGSRKVAVLRHVFSVVQIGSLRVQNMPITILAQRDIGIDRTHIGSRLPDNDEEEGGAEDMYLGADFMQKVHIWISHSSQTLIMQYPPAPSPVIAGVK